MHEAGPRGATSTCSGNITVTTADVAAADVVPGYTLEGMVGEGGFCQVCDRHLQCRNLRSRSHLQTAALHGQSHLGLPASHRAVHQNYLPNLH